MKIIVDADACPVKPIIIECARRYGLRVILIHSINHYSPQEDGIERVIVDHGNQSADMAIINYTQRGDLIITADIGLAALILGKGAYALNPWGKVYTNDNIDLMLEDRHFKQKILQQKGRIKGPAKRNPMDNQQFKQALQEFIEKHLEIIN